MKTKRKQEKEEQKSKREDKKLVLQESERKKIRRKLMGITNCQQSTQYQNVDFVF
jgi:hypothetical protein